MQQHFSNLRRVAETTDEAVGDLSEILRPLGSFEHLFWLMDQSHPVHFAVTAEVEGDASPRAWRRALDRVQERHPLLRVSIDGAPGRAPAYRREEGTPIPLRIVEDDDPSSRWTVEVGEELATPFDTARAPLVRAVLIQGRRDAALILVAHHSVADGMSLAFAIRDTLRAIDGGALKRLPVPPPQDEILRGMLVQGGGPNEVEEAAPAGPASTLRQRNDARPKVQGLSLAETFTARLRDRARQERTTVHAALLAAVGVAGRMVSAPWRDIPVRLVSPVNTRPTLGVGEDCGVFVGAATSTFHPGVGELGATGFWDLARHAKSSVAFGQTQEGIAAVMSALQEIVGNCPDAATASESAATTFGREALLTNLGSLPFAGQFGALKLKALWGPSVLQGLEGEQTIGAATMGGALFLTYTSHTPHGGLLDAMQSVLIEACAA
jgi:condensation domain-containing protein